MLRKILEDIGLKPNEAKVYLACLKLGTQDVKMVAKETGLSRYTATMILTNLLDRGFVSKFARQKDFFTPEQPQVIIKILENSKYQLEENIKAFQKVLPQFEDYMNPSFTKPEIAFYEAKEGVIAAYEDTLTSKTDILAIASVEDTESVFPQYVPKYYKRRKAAGILIRAIFPDSKMARVRQAKDKDELRISRLVPKDLMKFHIEMNIYDDKVAYFSIKEKLAIIVKSSTIADSMRDVFSMCWQVAELYQESIGLKLQTKKKKQI